MTHDLLLEWMSERVEGSWSQLRRAHSWLFATERTGWRPTPGFTARMLATLGHIEIDWEASRWAAAPPVLTILPSAGAHALLTGGRTRTLVDRLTAALDDSQRLFRITHEQRLAPSTIFIACQDERDIEDLARQLDVRYEYSVSDRLSQLLPDLDAYLQIARATPAARGYGVERFVVERLAWEDVSADDRPGLYRYDVLGRKAFRLMLDEGGCFAVDQATGVWAAVSRWGDNKITYDIDRVNGTMVVPLALPLPTLQARAAALCSGLAPGKDRDMLRYRNVPRSIAERIARSLDQTLQ